MSLDKETNIIFFHGFNSSNQTNKFTCIKHDLKQCVSVNYVEVGVDEVCDLYEEMIFESIQKYNKTILVGHSFGAYFANMFAIKYSLRALLIAPCMRPNVYIVDRMPEVQQYNFVWEKNYSNKVVYMIENEDECFDVETDINLIKSVPDVITEYMKVHRFDGGHHRICRSDVINDELNILMGKTSNMKIEE